MGKARRKQCLVAGCTPEMWKEETGMGKVSTATANHSEIWFAVTGSSGQQHSLSDSAWGYC